MNWYKDKCIHNFSIAPGAALPSSTAATASDEEDRDEDQCSYQEDGEDHQEEHIPILLLLAVEWDLLKYKGKGATIEKQIDK